MAQVVKAQLRADLLTTPPAGIHPQGRTISSFNRPDGVCPGRLRVRRDFSDFSRQRDDQVVRRLLTVELMFMELVARSMSRPAAIRLWENGSFISAQSRRLSVVTDDPSLNFTGIDSVADCRGIVVYEQLERRPSIRPQFTTTTLLVSSPARSSITTSTVLPAGSGWCVGDQGFGCLRSPSAFFDGPLPT